MQGPKTTTSEKPVAKKRDDLVLEALAVDAHVGLQHNFVKWQGAHPLSKHNVARHHASRGLSCAPCVGRGGNASPWNEQRRRAKLIEV